MQSMITKIFKLMINKIIIRLIKLQILKINNKNIINLMKK